jgi:hypothetical protein
VKEQREKIERKITEQISGASLEEPLDFSVTSDLIFSYI